MMLRSVVSTGLSSLLGVAATHNVQPCRTTWILKRRWAPHINKLGRAPRRLRARDYAYEFVDKVSYNIKPDMQVLLTSPVEGFGHPGDVVSVRPKTARNDLLLPKLAVYVTPENLAKYGRKDGDHRPRGSLLAAKLIQLLSTEVIPVTMHVETPWTLEPWHVRLAFRTAGYQVETDQDIEIPPERGIIGPDLSLEGKEFYVVLTVNKQDRIPVRCRLYHWSTDGNRDTPLDTEDLTKPADPIFLEDKEFLESLPRKKPPPPMPIQLEPSVKRRLRPKKK